MSKTIVTMTVEIEIEDFTPEEIREANADAGMSPSDFEDGSMGEHLPAYDPGDLIGVFHSHFDVGEGDTHTALDGIFDGSDIFARPTKSKIKHINVVRAP